MTVIGALSSFRKRGEMRPHNALQERFITGQERGGLVASRLLARLGGQGSTFLQEGGWVKLVFKVGCFGEMPAHGKHEKRFGEADPNWPD